MPDPNAVNSMFARVAPRYDLANRVLSGGMDLWWRRLLVAAVKASGAGKVLDVATGTGDVALALARRLGPGAAVTGVDFCAPMIAAAAEKKNRAGPAARTIDFREADALALPYPEGSFDAVTIAFGLRNFGDRAAGLREMRRVLRPGGRLFVLEFSQPAPAVRPLYFAYLRHIAPRIAGAITGEPAAYDYLCDSIESFPSRAALAEEFRVAGFREVTARPMTFGTVALHVGLNGLP